MIAKSTQHHYGAVAVTLHWASAAVILILLGSGFQASGAQDAATKAVFLRLHVPLGITVVLLTALRVAWWLFADRKPASLPMPRWQDRAARAVHMVFYVVIFGMAASGIAMVALSGAGPIIFGNDPTALPDFRHYRPRRPHGFGARAILSLFVLHAGAALYHHFIARDGMLDRMWFRRDQR